MTPFNLNEFVTDKKLDEEGVWLSFNGLRCRIANQSSNKYARAMTRHRKAIGEHIVRKSEKKAQEVVILAMADTVFLEFEGEVNLGSGVLTNSTESRVKMLKECTPFLQWVVNQANEIENFQKEVASEQEETLKSSPPLEP